MSELDEKALEIAAKRLCIEAMGGDVLKNHSNIASAWGIRSDRYRKEAQATINAYLASMAEKGFRMMPRTITGEMDASATDYYIPRPKSWTWEGVWKVMFDTFSAEQKNNPQQGGGAA